MAFAIAQRGLRNSNATTEVASSGLVGGGILYLLLEYDGSDADPTGFTGTLAGTWTKVQRFISAGNNIALYASTDYGTSGTIGFTATGMTASAICLIEVTDAGALDLSNPVKQSKTGTKAGGSGNTLTITLTDVVSNTTLIFGATDGTKTPGAGMTEIVDSGSWYAMHVAYSTSTGGVQAPSLVSSGTNANYGIAWEVGYPAGSGAAAWTRRRRSRKN